MRRCTACHRDLPATAEYFYSNGRALRGDCKECVRRQFRDKRAGVAAVIDDEPTARHTLPPRIEETLGDVDEHRLRRRVRELEERNRELLSQLSDAQAIGEVVRASTEIAAEPIAPRERSPGAPQSLILHPSVLPAEAVTSQPLPPSWKDHPPHPRRSAQDCPATAQRCPPKRPKPVRTRTSDHANRVRSLQECDLLEWRSSWSTCSNPVGVANNTSYFAFVFESTAQPLPNESIAARFRARLECM